MLSVPQAVLLNLHARLPQHKRLSAPAGEAPAPAGSAGRIGILSGEGDQGSEVCEEEYGPTAVSVSRHDLGKRMCSLTIECVLL